MRFRLFVGLNISLLLAAGGVWAAAQETAVISAAVCAPAMDTVWTTASDACIGGPVGYLCNGGSAPQVEPAGAVANALNAPGAMVETGVVDAIRTAPLAVETGVTGVAWLRPTAPIQYTGLLLGDVTIRDVTPPDFPAWQALVVQTGTETVACAAAPRSLFIVQTPAAQPTNIAINGVSLGLNGTVLVQTAGNTTIFAGLSGETLVFAYGQNQLLRLGQQVSVPYADGNFAGPAGPPGPPQLLDGALAYNLPVGLLDRPIIVPQAGYVSTAGAVNMRAAPSTDAGVIVQVPAGQTMAVLGRNTAGDWVHVRLDSGETGWMYAPLLVMNTGVITAIYDATPLPPQRYGQMGTTGKVVAPAGVNLRQFPDVTFPVVAALPDGVTVNLLARSPYNAWLKVEYSGLTGWLSLLTVDTRAIVDALPIDYNVPPPPPPTRVPGSFGNAFPDPNAPGN